MRMIGSLHRSTRVYHRLTFIHHEYLMSSKMGHFGDSLVWDEQATDIKDYCIVDRNLFDI